LNTTFELVITEVNYTVERAWRWNCSCGRIFETFILWPFFHRFYYY